jgi:LPS-assembly protein
MRRAVFPCVVCLLCAAAADAQEPPSAPAAGAEAPRPAQPPDAIDRLPPCEQETFDQIAGDHWRLSGNVDCDLPDGVKVFADVIDIFMDGGTTRIVAGGNVVFTGGEGHIAAERLEYSTGTGTGTFHTASGLLTLPGGDRTLFSGQEPVVYFYGERIERLGPRRYRVTRGAWTTCEQPTPRWDFTSGSMVLNLEDYVVATNTVFRVKGVPLFYVPYIYYPIQSDDRATGFLMPSYGTSTFRGQAISNAFFWAIGRSHDATFMHDLFTRAGQGAGVEYRYMTGPQSSGTFRLYRFGRRETESADNGTVTVLPASTSYEITGTAVQTLGPGVTGRVRLDYFSDVVSQQLLHQNVYDASRRNRLIEGGVTAARGPLSLAALYQRNEVINGLRDTIVYGSTPRATAALAPQRLFDSPVYASMSAEYAFLPYRRFVDGALSRDDSFARVDLAPSVRVPLSRLSFLSVNTSASYRGTYYSRRATDGGEAAMTGGTEPGSYLRQYATVRTDVVGPVVNRIWDLPDGAFADRLKHVVEPAVTVDFTSPIRDYRRTPVLSDVTDFAVGGSTRVTYGLTNRLFTRVAGDAGRGTTRELLTVGVQQTYYSRPEASRYDGTYVSAQGIGAQRELSPVAMNVRVSPSAAVDANARLEYGVYGGGLQVLTTGATLNAARSGLTLNYSRQRPDPALPASSFASASARTTFLQNRLSAAYSISLDIARSYVVSQGVVGSYMAQCCGVQAEFQQFNYPSGFGLPLPTDRRINVSFVLAGLGTFSNFFGAFGGL